MQSVPHSHRHAQEADAITPRVYIACLASYNSGILHGKWVDADEIHEGIQEVLESSPTPGAEEWAIHDHEGFGQAVDSEWPDIEELAELSAAIVEHGEAFRLYAENCGGSATVDGFEEAYCGEWDSEKDYAENLMDDLYEIPDYLQGYIDYEAFARELFMGDYWSATDSNYQLHVFRNT